MAKKAYVGVGGVAKTIKNMYVGIDGVARKIVKAYVGVAGKARQFWPKSANWPTYYTKKGGLSYNCSQLVSTNLGDIAIFSGGGSSYTFSINKSLSISTLESMQSSRSYVTATSVGNYAIFAGGESNRISDVDVYDTSSTHTVLDDMPYECGRPGGATIGNYALFAGGNNKKYHSISTAIAYSSSLTLKTSVTSLSSVRRGLVAANAGNSYAVFSRGHWMSNSYNKIASEVDAYNASLTLTALTDAHYYNNSSTASGSIGNYAIFMTGDKTADIYDSSLTLTTTTDFTSAATSTLTSAECCTTVNGYLLVPTNPASVYTNGYTTMDIFDESLTRQTITGFTDARQYWSAEHVGDYALFVAGEIKNGDSTTKQSNMFIYKT